MSHDDQSRSCEAQSKSQRSRSLRLRRGLTLESLITPGLKVKERGSREVLDDRDEIEPQVAQFITANVNRIFRPLAESSDSRAVEIARNEVVTMTTILVMALRRLYEDSNGH